MISDLLDFNLATGLIGVAGVLLGLFADRMLQRQGKVCCEMDPIELCISSGDDKGTSYTVHHLPVRADYLPNLNPSLNRAAGSPGVRCFINAKLFNEKEVKTGLRDVVLALDGSPPLEKPMLDRSTWRHTAKHENMDELEIVNLPSREWITLSLITSIDPQEAQMLAKCDRAWLVATSRTAAGSTHAFPSSRRTGSKEGDHLGCESRPSRDRLIGPDRLPIPEREHANLGGKPPVYRPPMHPPRRISIYRHNI